MSEFSESHEPRSEHQEADLEAAVPSLERLRERIVRAADEIVRLKTANAELAERVRTLEEMQLGATKGSGSVVSIDEDPEVLREKVGAFIRTIDRYLEEIDDFEEEA